MGYIGLIDCNNFFVSCERTFRPDLAKRPVVVLSSNDGCVVARSQEIKDKGIPMAAPYFQIKDILSDIGAVVFSSHFALYRDLSRRVFNIATAELGQIEQYSIDECFFQISGDDAMSRLSTLRSVIERSTGIPVTVGLAPSKTLAKLITKQAKKTTGLERLTKEVWRGLAPTVSLASLWGVGDGLARRFAAAGLKTAQDYFDQPPATIQALFGVVGLRLWHELRGEPALPIATHAESPRSHTSSRSFARLLRHPADVRAALSYHLYHIVAELVRTKTAAHSLSIMMVPRKAAGHNFGGVTAEVILPIPNNDIFCLEQQISKLFASLFVPGVSYKKAGVTIVVAKAPPVTASLFPQPADQSALTSLVVALNERIGHPVLGVGLVPQAGAQAWEEKREWRSPDYTTRWSDLCTARTDRSKTNVLDVRSG